MTPGRNSKLVLLETNWKIFHLHLDDDGQDCQCEPPLAPGCECNPDAADPDSFCPLDERWQSGWGDGRKGWWWWRWEKGWWCLQVSRLLSMQVLPRIFKLRLGTRPRWQGCSRIMFSCPTTDFECTLCIISEFFSVESTFFFCQVLNPPLMFVIDTTKSVKPDKDSIFNLTGKVVENNLIKNVSYHKTQRMIN